MPGRKRLSGITQAPGNVCLLTIVAGILAGSLLLFASCDSSPRPKKAGPIEFTEIMPGIFKAQTGNPEEVDFLSVAQPEPRTEAINELSVNGFPEFSEPPQFVVREGKTFLRIPLEEDELIYGLGLHFRTVQQRGRILRLHMDHVGESDDGRTHAPVPFYVSSKGYGLFINAARYIDIWIGTAVRKDSPNPPEVMDRNTNPNWSPAPYSDAIEILIPAPGAELILFTGQDMLEVVQRYNLFCGGGPIPPKWGLGFWHRVPVSYTDIQVRNEVQQFHEYGFPLDVIGLEPGWQSASYPCTYEWDPDRFPDPEKFVSEMKEKNIRINLWINPYIPPGSAIHNELKDFTGSHTVWAGEVPDYTIPEARQRLTYFFEQKHLNIGVSGYKIDEVDGFDSWLWPDVASFPSGLDGEQMRQLYALQMMEMINGLFEERNQRSWGLARGNTAAGTRYPYVLYSDLYSHQDFVTALVNSGFNGVLWTPEVRSSETGEEWVRRMQSSVFSPMATINAWASGTKPWSFPEVYEEFKEAAQLRLQLFPYLYSAFADYHFEGIPPFRALQLERNYPAIRGGIKDQYLAGSNLLVAPMFAGQSERNVILPAGKWFDFYSGRYVGENEVIKWSCGLDRIPLFVKDGGLIPMMGKTTQTPRPGEQIPLDIRVYGQASGSFLLYDDDGESFDYRKGKFNRVKISIEYDADCTPMVQIDAVNPDYPWAYREIDFTYMSR